MLMARIIMWFRRDLRLTDHGALSAAAAYAEVVPLFVVDPLFTRRAGGPRRTFMADALAALGRDMGERLVYRHGDPVDVVPQFAAEVGADAVYVSRDFGPYGHRRDAAVAARLGVDGRALRGIGTPYAVEPGRVTKSDGSPYAVFTPFLKAWLASGWTRPLDSEEVRWVGAPDIRSDGPPQRPTDLSDVTPSSERDTLAAWDQFVATRLDFYDSARDQPALDGTSRMSAALRWGIVHPRSLLAELQPLRAHDVFRSELGWREFYADVLFRHPTSAWQNLQPKLDLMPVDSGPLARDRFIAWQSGRTGYPIVDAGMRQLSATGWMHNRVRMIVASFLVKDLHLPWQWGARHFLQHLIDGDLASNSHGWQWVAGSGTDASPYFRIFNPTSQSERFDAAGDYIRRWVPELASLDSRTIHQPSQLRPDAYPAPIVNHAAERLEALRRYKAVTAAAR